MQKKKWKKAANIYIETHWMVIIQMEHTSMDGRV